MANLQDFEINFRTFETPKNTHSKFEKTIERKEGSVASEEALGRSLSIINVI